MPLTVLAALAALAAPAGCERPEPAESTPEARVEEAPAAQPTRPLDADLLPFYRLIEARRTGPARIRIRKYLNAHPEAAQAHFLFGLSYHREKRYGLARPHFEKAIELEPTYDPSHYFLGWGLYYSGDIETSRACFDRHLALRPEEPDTIFALGLLDLELDDLDAAEARFRRAIALQADSDRAKDLSKAHTRLADVFLARGAFADARVELQTAVDLYPDHYEAQFKLFRVLTRLGEDDDAAAAERAFLDAYQRIHPRTSFPE